MTNAHVVDYFVITAADLTALLIAWLAGRDWIEKKAAQLSKVNWERSGHLYWLSSDLMWTWMQAKDGNLVRLSHGLGKAVHHAESLGVGEPFLSRLKNLQSMFAGKQTIADSDKSKLIEELDDIISRIGRLAEGHQVGFKADPES